MQHNSVVCAFILIVLIAGVASPVMAEKRDDSLKAAVKLAADEKLTALTSSAREKLNELNKKASERIAALDNKEIENIAQLDTAKTRKIASAKNLSAIVSLNKERLEKLATFGQVRIDKLSDMNESELTAKLDSINVTVVAKESLLKARLVSTGTLRNATRWIDDADKNETESESTVNRGLAQLRGEKEKLQTCRTENSTACNQTRMIALVSAKDIVSASIDKAIASLERLKVTMESNDKLSDDTVIAATAEIDNVISLLQAATQDARAAETSGELKQAAINVKSLWARVENLINFRAAAIVYAETKSIINRLAISESKLDKVLAYADQKGINTSSLDAQISEFSSAVEDARSKVQSAAAKIEEATAARKSALADGNFTDSEKVRVDGLASESRALLKDARDAANKAYNILKGVSVAIHSFKELNVKEAQLLNAEDDLPQSIGEPPTVQVTGG